MLIHTLYGGIEHTDLCFDWISLLSYILSRACSVREKINHYNARVPVERQPPNDFVRAKFLYFT